MSVEIPASVLVNLTGRDTSSVVNLTTHPMHGGTGAATAAVARLTIQTRERDGRRLDELRVIRKTFRPLSSGRHRHGAREPSHWTYWKRELLAYGSGVLPAGPGLRAPRCYGVSGSTIYLEDVGDRPADVRTSARQLGAWQALAEPPNVAWLSGHQLSQRIEASDLDWSNVRSDNRVKCLWDARHDLLAELAEVAPVLSHGDFHQANLRAYGSDTATLDWGTLGLAPVGADLAHLALSTQRDLLAEYLSGLNGTFSAHVVVRAYRITLALVGSSRVHWMLNEGIDVPDGYVDFLWDNRPRPR
ncbi:phosphotransferase [Actinopolymorpha sp. B17G11]|uniref:phosphotransferase n=1 Tax=Actinopolymorpha sp. B17G11 TaxID=3160861 RepID=UPI0032E43C40